MRTTFIPDGRRAFARLPSAVGLTVLAAVAVGCGARPATGAQPPRVSPDYPRIVTDTFGNQTTIMRADRVVAAVPSVSDAIFGLDEGRRVVGRTREADWPPGAIEKVPDVGAYSALNVEGLLGLGVDLLIVPDWAWSFERNLAVRDQLQSVGVAVLVVPERRMAEQQGEYTIGVLEELVRITADALAVPEKGERLIEGMRADARAARALAEGQTPRLRVLSVLPYNPGSTRVTGAMKPEDLAIRLAGGINVAVEAGIEGEREVSPERLIGMAPDVIVTSEKIWNGADDPVAYHLATPGLSDTPAGKAKRFLTWPDTPTHRASWRLPRAARELAEKLYGG